MAEADRRDSRRTSIFSVEHRQHQDIGQSSLMSCLDQQYSFKAKLHKVFYENTYKMEPDSRFDAQKAEVLIHEILTENFSNAVYDPKGMGNLAKQVSAIIKDRMKSLGFERFKYVCNVTIGENENQGIKISSRYLWDAKRDNWTAKPSSKRISEAVKGTKANNNKLLRPTRFRRNLSTNMKLNVNGSVSGKYFVPHSGGVVLKATWANASRHCKKHGSRLTSITSAKESKAIQKFISKPNFADDIFWIGLHDKKKEGHFKWSDGQNVTFTNWGYGEPNGGKRENCAEITKKVPRVWNDASCGNKNAFICEKRQRRQMTGNPTGKNKDLTTIIGASVGGAVFIALVVLLIIFCIRKRQKRHSKQNVKGKMHSAGENNLMDVYDDVVTKNQSMEMKDQNIKTDVHSKKEAELSPYIELGPQDEPNLYEDLKDVTPEIPRRSSKKGADIGGEKETLVVEDTPKHDYENGDKLDANDGDYLQAITHNETDDGSYVDHYVHIVP